MDVAVVAEKYCMRTKIQVFSINVGQTYARHKIEYEFIKLGYVQYNCNYIKTIFKYCFSESKLARVSLAFKW